jgi:hypothetical protein
MNKGDSLEAEDFVECIDCKQAAGKGDQLSCVHGGAPRRKFYIYSMNEERAIYMDIKIKRPKGPNR